MASIGYILLGSALFGFLLFIPVGIAYLIARSIQRRVQRSKEKTEEQLQPI